MSGLIEALQKAGAADLAAIDEEIAQLNTRLETLKAAQKLLRVRLNGHAKPADRDGRADGKEDLVSKIYDLVVAKGELMPGQIAESLGIDSRSVGRIVNKCDWFQWNGQLVGIAKVN